MSISIFVRKGVAIFLSISLMLTWTSSSSAMTNVSAQNPAGLALVESIIAEKVIDETYLSESYFLEFSIEEKQIFENLIFETLLKEKSIEEVYYVEVEYIPQEQVYSYFDNETISNEFGDRIDFNTILTKLAIGSGVLIFAVALQCFGVPSTVVMQGVVGAGIGAGIGLIIGGLSGALTEIDKSGRASALTNLAISIAGCVLAYLSLPAAVPTAVVSLSLVLAGVFLGTSIGGFAYSATDAIQTFRSTDSFDIDWENIDWEEVGYSAAANSIKGAADGFMIGAIVGTARGAAKSFDEAKFRNTLPKNVVPLSDEQRIRLKNEGFSDKQLKEMKYNADTKRFYLQTKESARVGESIKTSKEEVKYIRKTIKLKGVEIEIVCADFEPCTLVEVKLEPSQYRTPNYAGFANKILKEKIVTDSSLKAKFSPDQRGDIGIGKTPRGYVWNHNETEGVLQLVPSDVHLAVSHTGGNFMWGANQE